MWKSILLLIALSAVTACASDPAVEARIEKLEARIQQQENMEALRTLAFAYGYFMDNGLTDQVVTLLADETEFCEITGYGRYDGRDGCAKIWNDILEARILTAVE